MNEDDYIVIQINDLKFKYITSMPDKFIDDWLFENFEEGIDYIYGDTLYILHAYTTFVKFLNIETATAFKLRWM